MTAAPKQLPIDRARLVAGRDVDKSILARELRLARERDGCSQERMSQLLLVQQPNVSRWESGHEPECPNALHARRAERSGELHEWHAAYVRFVAPRHQATPLPSPDPLPDSQRLHRLMRECSELPCAYAERIADGVNRMDELERELRECDDVIAVASEQRAVVLAEIEKLRGGV